jgi:hypothetical protein
LELQKAQQDREVAALIQELAESILIHDKYVHEEQAS